MIRLGVMSMDRIKLGMNLAHFRDFFMYMAWINLQVKVCAPISDTVIPQNTPLLKNKVEVGK